MNVLHAAHSGIGINVCNVRIIPDADKAPAKPVA